MIPIACLPNGLSQRGVDQSLPLPAPVFVDRISQAVILLAGDETNSLECCEMLLRLGEIADHQVGFAEMLVCAALARVERPRQPVMLEPRDERPEPVMSRVK